MESKKARIDASVKNNFSMMEIDESMDPLKMAPLSTSMNDISNITMRRDDITNLKLKYEYIIESLRQQLKKE